MAFEFERQRRHSNQVRQEGDQSDDRDHNPGDVPEVGLGQDGDRHNGLPNLYAVPQSQMTSGQNKLTH